MLRPLFDAIGRIVDQLGDHEASTASLAQRECIATLERLLFYGVTGSPRAIIRVWENVGLRDALLRDRFPYFKLDRFNPFTGHVDFQFYGKSRLAEYAHLAAIKCVCFEGSSRCTASEPNQLLTPRTALTLAQVPERRPHVPPCLHARHDRARGCAPAAARQ